MNKLSNAALSKYFLVEALIGDLIRDLIGELIVDLTVDLIVDLIIGCLTDAVNIDSVVYPVIGSPRSSWPSYR